MKSDSSYTSRQRCQPLKDYYIYLQLIIMVIGLAMVSIGAFSINSTVSRTTAVGAVCLGTILAVFSFMGWFGTLIGQLGFLHIYSRSSGLALLTEMAALVAVYIRRAQANQYGGMLWDFFYKNEPQFLYDVERSLHCCGYAASWDRAVPKTCTWVRSADDGCRSTIQDTVFQHHHQIVAAGLFIVGVQLILIIMTVILISVIEKEVEDEHLYMLLLPQQTGCSSSISPAFSRQLSRPNVFHSSPSGSQPRVTRYGSTLSAVS